MRSWTTFAALALATTTLQAQPRTFVVDASNGAGTDFTSIAAAVAAVPDGAALLVRTGRYAGFRTQGKALTILGQPGASIFGFLQSSQVVIESLPSGKSFVLKGLTFLQGSAPSLLVTDCRGNVLIDEVVMDYRGQLITPAGIGVVRSDHVTISRSFLIAAPAFAAEDASVVMFDSSAAGAAAMFNHGSFPAHHGVQATRSNLFLSRTQITGGAGLSFVSLSAKSAIDVVDCTTRLTGAVLVQAGRGATAVSAVTGSGGLFEHDPAVAILANGAAPPIAPSVPSSAVPIPSLSASGAPRGGSVDIRLTSQNGDAFFVLVSVPGVPIAFPQFQGTVWLDLNLLILFSSGIVPSTQTVSYTIPVPADARLLGAQFAWQALAGNGASNLRLSNAATYVHD